MQFSLTHLENCNFQVFLFAGFAYSDSMMEKFMAAIWKFLGF
jgi:hypothetical protein